jgi:hypothetical protein
MRSPERSHSYRAFGSGSAGGGDRRADHTEDFPSGFLIEKEEPAAQGGPLSEELESTLFEIAEKGDHAAVA